MILDIFHNSFEDVIRSIDVDSFLKLTDDIIFRYDDPIIDRLESRNLYKVVWEGVFTSPVNITYENLVKEYPSLENKIHIVKKKINYTSDGNPIDKVLFCKDDSVFTIEHSKKQMLMTEHFEEIVYRVIAKSDYKNVREQVDSFMQLYQYVNTEVQYK